MRIIIIRVTLNFISLITLDMSFSDNNSATAIVRPIGVFIAVLITHLGVMWSISAFRPTPIQQNDSIHMLESFVLTSMTTQADRSSENSEMSEPTPKPSPEPLPDRLPEPLPDPLPEPLPQEVSAPAPIQPTQPLQRRPPVKSPAQTQHPRQPQSAASFPTSPQKSITNTTSNDITLPVTQARYLNNPHPTYPRQSRRLGEQGTVVIAVQIDIDGTALQALIRRSSGHSRLDQIALDTILKWRFVAGKKAGVPQRMWAHIPINFVLE